MTPRHFFNKLAGFRKKEDRDSKERWLLMRKVVWATIAVHAKKAVSERELMPFDFEEEWLDNFEKKEQEVDEEEYQAMLKRWEERDRKKSGES